MKIYTQILLWIYSYQIIFGILIILIINNSLSNDSKGVSDSTNIKTKLSIDSNDSIINESLCLKKLNSLRANYYLKYKLYDIILVDEIFNFNKNFCPPKYEINKEFCGFMYTNDLITYSITIIGFLANKIINYDLNNIMEVNGSQYYSLLGLYFCGNTEEITIDNKSYIKSAYLMNLYAKNVC